MMSSPDRTIPAGLGRRRQGHIRAGRFGRPSGLGTTALNLFDTDGLGDKRDSHGFYLQGLATFGKFSVGGGYGESNLDYANAVDALANPTLVDKNSSWVWQVRYGLNSWVTLLGEYVPKAHNGNKATSDAIAAGAILFFRPKEQCHGAGAAS